MANGQALPAQFVYHTQPYKDYNFQSDGASRYFGLRLRKLASLTNFALSLGECLCVSSQAL